MGRYRQAQCWLLQAMHSQSWPPPLRAPRLAPHHHTPAHPQEERRRELNFLRIYWAGGCPAFQAGPSSSCTRDGLAGESVLRVPATALLHFSVSAAPPSSHTAMGPSHWDSWVPSLPSDLGCIPGPIWASVCLSSMGGCYFLVKRQVHSHSVSRIPWKQIGFRCPLSVSYCSCCSLRPLSLTFHWAQIYSDARASDPRKPGIHIPWQEEEVGPEQGVGQLTDQVPGRDQEELGFSTEG